MLETMKAKLLLSLLVIGGIAFTGHRRPDTTVEDPVGGHAMHILSFVDNSKLPSPILHSHKEKVEVG